MRFSQREDGIYGWWGQTNDTTLGIGYEMTTFTFAADESNGCVTTPDGIQHKENFGITGNMRGLSTGMETIVSGIKKKWTTAAWASDSPTKPLRPRVTETNIIDNVNNNATYDPGVDYCKRTTIDYFTVATQTPLTQSVKLPWQIKEYAADTTTVLRCSQTDYMDDPTYNTRRIIGLPTEQRLYDGSNVLQSKVGYLYDSTNIFVHTSVPSQHDSATYNNNFYTRGNLTNVRRYDVTSSTAYTETQTDYYVTGNPSATRDALNHETKITYADSFATYADDAANTATPVTPTTATFAYPTDIEDAEHYHSKLKYWYATGANTRAENPLGAVSLNIYEMQYFGRPIKSKNTINGAYTRYEYSTDHNWFRTWTTVNSLTEETSNLQILDGASRSRVVVTDHPGSSGGLTLSYKVFDIMGRVVEWSNPTEIGSTTWAPFGDDVAGYNIQTQTYDWKGRPLITYNQDYNAQTNPGSKRVVSYEGCGCAGTQTTTVTDEMQRVQKAYSDILGRTFKTEIYNGSSVYSSAQSTFNVRDQVTNTTEYAGAVGSTTTQSTVLTYDGYGRLWKSRKPIETTDNTYLYNPDDTINTMTDARGAITNYGYDNRHLVTAKSFVTNGSGASATSPVTFQYDAAGHRKVMDDGPGVVTYNYNTLGQLTSEVRTFDTAGAPTTPFTITYGEYNPAGQVKNIKDPFNDEVNYSYDKIGRLSSIIGVGTFGGNTNYPYLSAVTYRAWGGVSGGRTYDSRMRVSSSTSIFPTTYQYDLSSRLTSSQPSGANPYTQTFSYDGIGRSTGVSTPEMSVPSQYVQTQTNPPNGLPSGLKIRPFTASITFDEFGNMTGRDGAYWNDFSSGGFAHQTFETTYENGRAKKDGIVGRVLTNTFAKTWAYNAEGEIVADGGTTMQYDVPGQLVKSQSNGNANVYTTHAHDGDGRQVKFEQKLENGLYAGGYEVITRYRIFSSVTGKLLTEIDAAGQKIETHIYTIDGQFRLMKAYSIKATGTQFNNYPEQIVSEYSDPKGTQARQWDRQTNIYHNVHMSPAGVANENIKWDQVRDRFVGSITAQLSFAASQAHYPGTRSQLEDPNNPGTGCELDGKPVFCGKLIRAARHGELNEDSVKFYDGSQIQGPGYVGGKGWQKSTDDKGIEHLNEIGNLIDGGDINADLIVDMEGGGSQTTSQSPCSFTIAMDEPTDLVDSKAISTLKSRITSLYNKAGFGLTFVNPGNSADFSLTYFQTSDFYEASNPNVNFKNTAGYTDFVKGRGAVFIDNIERSLNMKPGLLNVMKGDSNLWGLYLGTVGAHEITHGLRGAGHQDKALNLMQNPVQINTGLSPDTALSPSDILKLRSRCNWKPIPLAEPISGLTLNPR